MDLSSAYYGPMDSEYYGSSESNPRLEQPVMSIDELGVTVPEKNPVTGGHMLQNVDAAIRMGASKMQISMSVPHTSSMGGRPKAYGKDFRESMRELARANEVQIAGVEMPTTSMSNLSGLDLQRGSISEQKRQQDMQEVREAIKFVGDVAGGGGVDVFSQEFLRDMYDADWNVKGPYAGKFKEFGEEKKFSTAYVVDKRSGRIQQLPKGQPIYEPVYKVSDHDYVGEDVDGNKGVQIKKGDLISHDGKYINPEKTDHLLLREPEIETDKDGRFKGFSVKELEWDEIIKRTEEYNSRHDKKLSPEAFAMRTQLDNKWIQAKGQSIYYSQRYTDYIKQRESLKKSLEVYEKIEAETVPEDMWTLMDDSPMRFSKYAHLPKMKPTDIIKKEMYDVEQHLKHVHEASSAAEAQAMEVEKQKEEMVSLGEYALEKAVDSYAELGVLAMDETNSNPEVNRPIHVGPELGWPTAYGGHPEEFIELIKKSREKMIDKLQRERHMPRSVAEKKAKEHISGCFDTSHMGMWIDYFDRKPGENDEARLQRFKGWFMDMVKKMEKEEVIGSIQAVDSATGAHGHLPAGQGIFPVVEAVDYLKGKGWNGFVVSEGHEEEQFGQGRILLETWKAFGADIAGSYFAGQAPQRWNQIADNYFGHANPPPYIVGAYSPSEDWVFWSGVPLE